MAEASLTVSSKNYSSWSLRGFLLCRMAGLDFAEKIAPIDDPATRDPPDPERQVQGEGPRGDDRHALAHGMFAQAHHGPLPELLLDLRQRDVQHPVAFHARDLLDPPSPGAQAPDPTRRNLTQRL